MKTFLWSLAAIIAGLLLCGGWIYARHFWYKNPQYQLGIKFPENTRDIVVICEPLGRIEFGSGGEKWLMDPKGIPPQKAHISFKNENRTRSYEIELNIGASPQFRGKILIVAQRLGDEFNVSAEMAVAVTAEQ